MPQTKPHVTIYTDGGCEPNPGVGGWGAVIIFEDQMKTLSGGSKESTNNRMELSAVIEALESLPEPYYIDLYTDSEYVKKGITEWIHNWIRKEWRDVKNADLWQQLHRATQRHHQIEWHWVKGHAGNEHNELCDQLAASEIQRIHAEQAPIIPSTASFSIYIRTDCGDTNYGTCGWGAIIISPESQEQLSGNEARSSGQQLVLLAATTALKSLPYQAGIILFSDSSYLINGITQWVPNWQKNGWRNSEGNPVKYRELWEELHALAQNCDIQWIQVRNNVPTQLWDQVCQLAAKARDKTAS